MRPLKSHISLFSLKYHIEVMFLTLKAAKRPFCHRPDFTSISTVASDLKLPLRLEKLYCEHNDCHWPG